MISKPVIWFVEQLESPYISCSSFKAVKLLAGSVCNPDDLNTLKTITHEEKKEKKSNILNLSSVTNCSFDHFRIFWCWIWTSSWPKYERKLLEDKKRENKWSKIHSKT